MQPWKSQPQIERLKTLYQLLDLTSLRTHDPFFNIQKLCASTRSVLGDVATLLVYPCWVSRAKQHLVGTAVRVGTVVNYPVPALSIKQLQLAISEARAAGAEEVDIVMPYHFLQQGQPDKLVDFVAACRETCGDNILFKAILETGALEAPTLIDQAAAIAIEGGADFLKTCTGTNMGAGYAGVSEVVVRRLVKMIYDSGRPVGLKVSGGISTVTHAMQLTDIVASAWGGQSVTPLQYRIGSSKLRTQLVSAALMTDPVASPF